ncbi:hypothetical protein [Bradyrhizobium sp. 23AC]
MTNALLARARLAVEENGELRRRQRHIQAQFERAREQLRLSVYESASIRSEIKARRDNEE